MTVVSGADLSHELITAIDCSRNEFLYPHPIVSSAVWPKLDAGNICRYQSGTRLLAHLAERVGCEPELLRVHSGAEAALKAIFAAVARMPDATLLLPEPGWDYHATLAHRYGIRTELYRYRDEGSEFLVDRGELDDLIERIAHPVVLIVSPSNPLGCRVADEELQELAQRVGRKGYCVIDQAYFGFADPPNLDWSIEELLDGMPGTILVRTLSKYYGIPGLRVGFTAAHPGLHTHFGIEPDYLGFNVFADEFAVSCLQAHGEFAEIAVATVCQREALAAGLAEIPGFKPYRSQANFLLVRTPSTEYVPWLAQHGIKVRGFTSELADCIRITVPPEAHVRRILDVTASFAASYLA